jgi:hypothetical protein
MSLTSLAREDVFAQSLTREFRGSGGVAAHEAPDLFPIVSGIVPHKPRGTASAPAEMLLQRGGGLPGGRATGVSGLHGRAGHRAIRAEHAAITRCRAKPCLACRALIKELAGVRRHGFPRDMAAKGAGDVGRKLERGQRAPPAQRPIMALCAQHVGATLCGRPMLASYILRLRADTYGASRHRADIRVCPYTNGDRSMP